MTTIVSGINRQSVLTVLQRIDNPTNFQIKYRVVVQTMDNYIEIKRDERTKTIQNIAAQFDEDNNEVAPANLALDNFRDGITSYQSLVEASELEAIEHATLVGLFTPYEEGEGTVWDDIPAPPINNLPTFASIVGIEVGKDFPFSYDGAVYRTKQKHMPQAQFPPSVATAALYTLIPQSVGGGLPPWVGWPIGPLAQVGDENNHNGQDWRNRRPNNASEPGTANSGWLQISNTPAPWYFIGNEGYPLNWTVTENGNTYLNTTEGNTWAPSTGINWTIQ